MKKKTLLTLTVAMCIFFTMGLGACSKVEFSVDFIVEENVYAAINTNGKEVIRMPENPTKEGYMFDGWYWDNGVWQKPFTANSLLDAPLSSNMRVYAKFILNTVSGVSFEGLETVYDGTEKTITVTNLPDGASVEYDKNNTYINAGEYVITATISKEGYADLNLTATLKIKKATYDMSNVIFEGDTVTYDGNEHYIYATNLPFGVEAKYEGNGKIDAGKHYVKAKFIGDYDNYEQIEDKIVLLNIEKAKINKPIPCETQFVYNGLEQEYIIPKNENYVVTGNKQTSAGNYFVTIKLANSSNYQWADNTIEKLSYPFNIKKAKYNTDDILFYDKVVTYNGKEHDIVATNLPKGVTVTYKSTGDNVTAGKYIITALLVGDSQNYEPIPNLTAQLIIEKANYVINNDVFIDKYVTYNGETHTISVGELPEGVSVQYYLGQKLFNGVADTGEYEITAKFIGDYINYNIIPDKYAYLTIIAKQLAVPSITSIEYDVVSWSPVEGAEYYLVCVNDNYELFLRGNSCALADVKWDGEHITNYGQVAVKVMAQGNGNYSDSNWSETNNSYFYVPAVKSETVETLIKYSIGFGYNLIEDEYLDSTQCSQKSVFNTGKLLTIGNYTERANTDGKGYAYNYSSIDEFIAKTSINFEYGNTVGCVLLGSMKKQISAGLDFNYKKYTYKNTFIYEYNITYQDHVITNFSSDDLLYYCLSDDFLKDIKRESAETQNMTDDMLVEYLYNTYGTHAILGITTGGSWHAEYSIATNKQNIAAGIKAGFNMSTEGGAIDQIIQNNFSLSLDAKLEIESNTETTEAKFNTYFYGGLGGATSSIDGVNSALAEWSSNMSRDNARSIKFTENGAISLSYLLSLYDISFSNKFANYVDRKTTEQYKALFEQYSTSISLPIDMQNENGRNVLTIDLSEFQENGHINNVSYPTLSSNVLTIYPIMFAKNVDLIKIKGAYDTCDTLINALSIKLSKEWKGDVNILIENLGVYAVKDIGFIDATELDSQYAVNLQYAGKNKIAGQNATSSVASSYAIKMAKLNILSTDENSNLTISGGNGYSATSIGGSGTNGATAVVVDDLIIDLSKKGKLVVEGGAGGDGKYGADGEKGSGNDSPGDDGGNGGNGGNGASAFSCGKLKIINTKALYIVGGNGGNGGNGGRGGDGTDDNQAWLGSARNGRGGNGGNGGNGGSCLNVVECMNFEPDGPLNVVEGTVGAGGRGGDGGNGGDANNSMWEIEGADGGAGGTGGLNGDGKTRAPNGNNGTKGD